MSITFPRWRLIQHWSPPEWMLNQNFFDPDPKESGILSRLFCNHTFRNWLDIEWRRLGWAQDVDDVIRFPSPQGSWCWTGAAVEIFGPLVLGSNETHSLWPYLNMNHWQTKCTPGILQCWMNNHNTKKITAANAATNRVWIRLKRTSSRCPQIKPSLVIIPVLVRHSSILSYHFLLNFFPI